MSAAAVFSLLSLILALGATMTIGLSEATGSQPQDADAGGRKTVTPVVLHEDFAGHDFLDRLKPPVRSIINARVPGVVDGACEINSLEGVGG
jgi:hypothetical protein